MKDKTRDAYAEYLQAHNAMMADSEGLNPFERCSHALESSRKKHLEMVVKVSLGNLTYGQAPELLMPSIQTNNGPRAHIDHMRVGRRKYGSTQR